MKQEITWTTGIETDEQGPTAAGFLLRAAAFFTSTGIDRVEAVMTDNHWSYTKSRVFSDALNTIGTRHVTIRPHCPWQNGKVERFNRTLQTEWAYHQVYISSNEGLVLRGKELPDRQPSLYREFLPIGPTPENPDRDR